MNRVRWNGAVVIAAAVGVPVILLVMAFLVNRGFEETARLRREVERSYETRAALEHVLSLHQDIELGQRGYLITGDESFLRPYRDASRNVDQALISLGDANRGVGDTERLAAPRATSDAKRRFVDRTLRLQAQGKVESALQLVRDGEGKQLMERLRDQIAELSRIERARLADRTTAV